MNNKTSNDSVPSSEVHPTGNDCDGDVDIVATAYLGGASNSTFSAQH